MADVCSHCGPFVFILIAFRCGALRLLALGTTQDLQLRKSIQIYEANCVLKNCVPSAGASRCRRRL